MLKVYNKIDISGTVLGIITIITVLMLKSKNNLEFLQTNEEVLATIASIYNKDNMTVTNLNVTGVATIAGATNITGDINISGATKTTNVDIMGKLNILPKGIIVAWHGTQSTVPFGWVLCNGANGTPDLRSRFIVGTGGGGLTDYGWGNTGGLESVTLTIDQMPGHTHGMPGDYGVNSSGSSRVTDFNGSSRRAETRATGGNQAHENRPPYYALAWIMKS